MPTSPVAGFNSNEAINKKKESAREEIMNLAKQHEEAAMKGLVAR